MGREKSFAPSGIRKPEIPARSLVTKSTALTRLLIVKGITSITYLANTLSFNFYHFTVHSIDYLITHSNICAYYLRNIKFTLKHLKRSYIFRSHDHPQGAYIVPC